MDGIMGSPWTGLDNFLRLFNSEIFFRSFKNTLIISLLRIVFGFPVPVIFALLLDEIYNLRFKKLVQTVSYLPYFISWIILGGIVVTILSPTTGIVNYILGSFGKDPVYFMTEAGYFRLILIVSGIWQSTGWNSIVYISAISSIESSQYESARIDGANRFKQAVYITIPSILPVISIMFILGLGQIMNAGFDQVFNLYNPMVYETGDIIDTYVYRVGLVDMQYSFSTAVGLFKNIIGFILVMTTNFIVRSYGDYSLW